MEKPSPKIEEHVWLPAVSLDTETELMAMGNLIPEIVVACLSWIDEANVLKTSIAPRADKDELNKMIDSMFQFCATGKLRICFANAAYDLAVIMRYRPDLTSTIFHGLAEGWFEDILLRERLIHLSTHGNLENEPSLYDEEEDEEIVGGGFLKFNLGELSKRYLGKDRTKDKDMADAWRINYGQLKDVPLDQWPIEAKDYVSDDAKDTLHIRQYQEEARKEIWTNLKHDPFMVQDFLVAKSFALHMVSAWGQAIDPVEFYKIDAMLKESLKPEKLKTLLDSGVLRPGVDPRPKGKPKLQPDGTMKQEYTKGKAPSVNKAVLQQKVKEFCEAKGLEIPMTPPSDKYPEGQVQTKKAWFKANQNADPLFKEYYDRQVLMKLVSTELPGMCLADGVTPAPIVHPSYNALVATGRTSSFASSIVPSRNGQNVDPRVRPCFVPREGFLYFSIDYNQMELATAAQTCYDLFKYSVMREKINEGADLHSYLGSQLAYALDANFKQSCQSGGATTPDQIFKAFLACKKSPDEKVQKFFAHYRKFAKPTGLGYPGGLGAKTFMEFAKATYDVDVDEDMAKLLKEIWLNTYPEFQEYFKWITTCTQDLVQPDKFAYRTPMGLYRAGCSYCAIANGKALQSPSAEGATLSLWNIVRATMDPAMNSILGDDENGVNVRVVGFIHDENLGEIRKGSGSLADRQLRHDRCVEMARIMVESMRTVTPDVTPRATPVLMERWDKNAEPVYDSDGLLDVWKPKPKK